MTATNDVCNKRRRSPFSMEEKQQIVKFISASKSFHKVGGTSLWKQMAAELSSHSWQSLRQHFFRKIKPNIDAYKLEPSAVTMFKFRADCDVNRSCSKKLSRYTAEEDEKIVNYIESRTAASIHLSGNKFWKKMQHHGCIPGRSWQSVRERYLKHLKKKRDCDDFASQKLDDSLASSLTWDPKYEINDQRTLDAQAVVNKSGTGLSTSKCRKRKLFTLCGDGDSQF